MSATFLMSLRMLLIIFIFYLFTRQDGEIKVPELVYKTTQGGLVNKLTHQQAPTLFLRDKGDITKPVSPGAFHAFFEQDVVNAALFGFLLSHISLPSKFSGCGFN